MIGIAAVVRRIGISLLVLAALALSRVAAEDGDLAQAQFVAGAFDEATTLRRRALDTAVAKSGCDSPSTAAAMAALAALYVEQGRYLDAEPLLITARQALADHDAGDSSAMAATLSGLARVALAHGDTKPSQAWATQAVDIARRHPDIRSAEPQRALGAALTADEHFDDAERALTEALTLDRKYHGADAIETARSLSQLANLYLRQGRAADALPLIQQAAAIDQNHLGANHPYIADDLHDLGRIYEALKRIPEARKALAAALETLERGAGRETPRVAYVELDLSRILRDADDEAAADAAFKDARRILNTAEAAERKRERKV